MRVSKLRLAALALTSGLALGGCAYGFGDPYGSYGSVGVGYGNYGYGDYGYGYGGYPYGGYGYGSYPYGGYGYGGYPYGGYGYGGYGSPFGWYDNYYYPGTGIYVYDRDRHRRVMTDAQRQYWRDKFARYHSGSSATTTATTTTAVTPRENWSEFNRIRTRSVDSGSSSTTRSANRGHAWGRQSTTTTSSTDTTTTTRSDNDRRGRGHDRSNPQ